MMIATLNPSPPWIIGVSASAADAAVSSPGRWPPWAIWPKAR